MILLLGMSTLLMIGIGVAGLGFLLVLYKLLKKGTKLASKLPTNFLVTFLIFGLLGLLGFMLSGGVAEHPVMMGVLLLIVSVTVGTRFTFLLYERWEWSMAAPFWRKLLYLFGIGLTAFLSFALIFLLCEHRGRLTATSTTDLVWPLGSLCFVMLLPLLIKHLHELWNEIPKINRIISVFNLPLGGSPPFIETGGPSISFLFVIPLEHGSKETVKSTVALPYNKTLEEAFHYKLHEHNVVKRFAKKIVYAENNKRDKVYAWRFYREIPVWWGWLTRKHYLDPKSKLGATISKGESVFVERVKPWEAS